MRTTAAKQLAQLAAKSVRSDVGGDDVNVLRIHGSLDDPSAWAELMSVVARVGSKFRSWFISVHLTIFLLLGPSLPTFTILRNTNSSLSRTLSNLFTCAPLGASKIGRGFERCRFTITS